MTIGGHIVKIGIVVVALVLGNLGLDALSLESRVKLMIHDVFQLMVGFGLGMWVAVDHFGKLLREARDED